MIKIDATTYYKTKDLLEIASPKTVLKWINTNNLKAQKVGRDYLIKGSDLMDFFNKPKKSVASKTAKKKPKKS